MKAIQKPKPESGFVVTELPTPSYGPDDVLIEITYASICGTDLHITRWDEWSASRIKPPLTYGHEFCGRVSAIGNNVTNVALGDYVSAEMHIACNECYPCMTGKHHICQNLKIAGIDLDGCYAGFIVLPKAQVIKLPESIPPESAACLDAVGNAVHAATKGEVSGKSVLVTGCGPVGLFSVAAAKALGASQVFASDIQPYRLDLAKKAGCDLAIQADTTDVVTAVLEKTHYHGVDVVLEMSGNNQALNTGFEALKPGGTVVLLGIPSGTVELDITKHIIFKEAKVLGVTGREMFKTWFVMLDLLESGKLSITDLITHQFPLDEFGKAIDLVASGQSGKVLLVP